jgi:hypothetical protein
VFWTPLDPDFVISMPLPRGPDGDVDLAQAYRLLCRVHPDLGGTEAREPTPDEKRALSDLDFSLGVGRAIPFWERGCFVTATDLDFTVITTYTAYDSRFNPNEFICEPDDDPPGLDGRWVEGRWDGTWDGFYTDSTSTAQPPPLYWLPPIPPGMLDQLADGTRCETTPAAQATASTRQTTTTTKPETQRWEVTISGYEIDEMDRYWQITTRVRGAVRFDYDLQGEFTLLKEDGRWVFDTGRITFADVRATNEYRPEGSWELREFTCPQCERITAGRTLNGEVNGEEVRLSWGTFRPEVTVHAKIAVPCRPTPDCSEWKNRTFESSEFFQNINGQSLRLAEGSTSSPPYIDPAAGLRWLDYTIVLRRLDG